MRAQQAEQQKHGATPNERQPTGLQPHTRRGGGKSIGDRRGKAPPARESALTSTLAQLNLAADHAYRFQTGDCYFDSLQYLTGIPSRTIRLLAVTELHDALANADTTAISWLNTHTPADMQGADVIRNHVNTYLQTMGNPATSGNLNAWADNAIAHWAGIALGIRIQCHTWNASTQMLNRNVFGARDSDHSCNILFTGPLDAGHYTPCRYAHKPKMPSPAATDTAIQALRAKQEQRWSNHTDKDTVMLQMAEYLASHGSVRSAEHLTDLILAVVQDHRLHAMAAQYAETAVRERQTRIQARAPIAQMRAPAARAHEVILQATHSPDTERAAKHAEPAPGQVPTKNDLKVQGPTTIKRLELQKVITKPKSRNMKITGLGAQTPAQHVQPAQLKLKSRAHAEIKVQDKHSTGGRPQFQPKISSFFTQQTHKAVLTSLQGNQYKKLHPPGNEAPRNDPHQQRSAKAAATAAPLPQHAALSRTTRETASAVLTQQTRLKLLHYTLRGSLNIAEADVKMLLEEEDPDVVSLADVGLRCGQKRRAWVQNIFKGYKVWTPLGQKSERVHVLLAIKDHIALHGQANQPESNCCHQTQGRLVNLKLALPHSKPLTISAIYAPVGSHGNSDLDLRDAIYKELEQHMSATHIIMGDMNAGLQPGDRDGTDYECAKDKKHRSFVARNGLIPIDAHMMQRQRSFYQACYDGTEVSSRIDDIIINQSLTRENSHLTVLNKGTLSDHRPLLVSIQASALGVFIPSKRQPRAATPPTKVLVRPISEADRKALEAKLASHNEGPIQAINELKLELTEGLKEVQAYFLSIEAEDGKNPNRLQSLRGEPAHNFINRLAKSVTGICQAVHATALDICQTKVTNPQGRHYTPRTAAKGQKAKGKAKGKKRTRYCKQLAAIRAVKAAAATDNVTELQDIPHLVSKATNGSTAEAVTKTWAHTCEQQSNNERTVGQMLQAAADTVMSQIKPLDKQQRHEELDKAAARQRRLLATKPRLAHRRIFQKQAQESQHKALKDPENGTVTDCPGDMLDIVTRHFTQFQRAPRNCKSGEYLPHKVPRDYPLGKSQGCRPIQPANTSQPTEQTPLVTQGDRR